MLIYVRLHIYTYIYIYPFVYNFTRVIFNRWNVRISNIIDGTGFYWLISIVRLVVDATREQLKFISTLYTIPLGHTAALVQSLAEMRVTVYAASFSSTQSRGCSLVYARISQIARGNVKVGHFACPTKNRAFVENKSDGFAKL